MNTQLIKKLIVSHDETCPEFIFSNPLLDRKVTKAVSKCLIKTLTITKRNGKDNLRMSVLENIRKMCKVEPEGHLEVNNDLTEMLVESYQKQIKESTFDSNDWDKDLDLFLVRSTMEMKINSCYKPKVNLEVAQAMLNLDQNDEILGALSKDVAFWNTDDAKCSTVFQQLWDSNSKHETFFDYASTKVKFNFENVILNITKKLLTNEIVDINNIFELDNDLISLVSICANSADCFQICIAILNSLFVKTNFNSLIEKFISTYIQNVKIHSPKIALSALYPAYLSSVVILLDIDLDIIPYSVEDYYTGKLINILKELHDKSELDVIMLLSHFPHWFDTYFKGL